MIKLEHNQFVSINRSAAVELRITMESIRESKMNVMAQLGVAQLSLDDVYNLHVGDVIDLNKPQNSLISLYVEGQPWFNGQLGVHNKNMAVKIENRILEAKNEDVAV